MQTRERWKQASLHWLLQDERVKEAMSIEFNFNHPSDTLLCGNPIYRITSREEGYVDTGKFHEQHLLRSRDASPVRCDMDQMDDASRLEAFTVYCHAVMRTWFSECAVDGTTRRVCLCPSGKLGGTECGLTTCWQIICQSGAS